MTTDPEDPGESRRQIVRRQVRVDGDVSAKLARQLMELSNAALGRVGLDDDLRAEVDRARRITSLIARRREERRLAGVLRRADTDDLTARLAKVQGGGTNDARPFHAAEAWRTRLLDEPGAAAVFAAEYPAADPALMTRLLDAAHRERATGRPPGAAKALFRHVLAELATVAEIAARAAAAAAENASEDDADPAD